MRECYQTVCCSEQGSLLTTTAIKLLLSSFCPVVRLHREYSLTPVQSSAEVKILHKNDIAKSRCLGTDLGSIVNWGSNPHCNLYLVLTYIGSWNQAVSLVQHCTSPTIQPQIQHRSHVRTQTTHKQGWLHTRRQMKHSA